MLAAFGFIVTGLLVAAFADTFRLFVEAPRKLRLWQFSSAYYCVSFGLITWGLAGLSSGEKFLRFAILTGDGLLIAATVLFASLLVPALFQVPYFLASTLTGISFLMARAVYFPVTATVHDGVLFFNSQTAVSLVVACMLGLVWLPVNVRVARYVAEAYKLSALAPVYSMFYGLGVLTAILFVFAERRVTIIITFLGVAVVFALLIYANYLLPQLKTKAKKHAK